MTPDIRPPYVDPSADVLLARIPARRRALFLDRDGVINVDLGYVHTPEKTVWLPGIFDLCRAALDLGFLPVIITNQAGIARGYYDEAEFADYSRWMHEEFARRGLGILATYHCPHHPAEGIGGLCRDCSCRKPKPGMILRAQADFGLDLPASALIGDKDSDLAAGLAAGVGHRYKLAENGVQTDAVAGAAAWLQSLVAGEP